MSGLEIGDKVLRNGGNNGNGRFSDISGALDITLQELLGPPVEATVHAMLPGIVSDYLRNSIPSLEVVVKSSDGELLAKLPRQHYLFSVVLKMMEAIDVNQRLLNVALIGPAGTGKSELAINAGKALSQEIVLQPFNPQTTKADLLGFMHAGGKYVPSPLYNAMKKGLTFIADEFDAANPATTLVLNSAIASRVLTFPNAETLKAHQNFRAIVCMNTCGRGGDERYTGRQRLDAATLDRFVYLNVPIDPGIEAFLAGEVTEPSPSLDIEAGGRYEDGKAILRDIINFRGHVEALGKSNIVSPRATAFAYALHTAGFGKEFIWETCLWKGMPKIDRDQIMKRFNK